MIGKKRPAFRSITDIKNYMLECLELNALGKITSAELRQRTAAAKDTAEVHAALKLMELQGISFDMDAQPTGIEYKPVVKRILTKRSGVSPKGPIDEETSQEVQEAAGDTIEHDFSAIRPDSLKDRLAFGGLAEGQKVPSEDDDIIPW